MEKIDKENKCKMCGYNLDLCAPHREDGKAFCSTLCALNWRMSKEPIQKILS